MPTDAFTRAVESISTLKWFQFTPEHMRAAIVRKVLGAIREPDEAVVTAGDLCSTSINGWEAMIDAILIQDPEIPVVGRLVAD